MTLSRRTAWQRQASPVHYPLSDSNPTHFFPREVHLPSAPVYVPEPFGMLTARQAVRDYYARRQRDVALDRIAMTASTSEAYAHAFALFCDPGDAVLAPSPSYPLFDALADVSGVRLVEYPLFYADGWHLDRASIEAADTRDCRALVVVSPNNPTGHYVNHSDWTWINGFARERGLGLIVDEVFADYSLDMPSDAQRFITSAEVPCLTLSGLSKVAALPQLKLGWMVLSGPCDELRARLEILLDTFLSVSSPVQLALPELLLQAEPVQAAIRSRCRENLRQLDALRCEGGWAAIVRPPLEGAQPGSLFGIRPADTSVVSLLLPPSTLAAFAKHGAAPADTR